MNYLLKYIDIILLFAIACHQKEQNDNTVSRKIIFLNNSGSINFKIDSAMNDCYFYSSGNCTGSKWQHVIKNINLPKVFHGFLSSGYSDSIYYLYISYPPSKLEIKSIQELDKIEQVFDSKLGPNRIPKSFIRKFGQHEYVISGTSYSEDKNTIGRCQFWAKNEIEIVLESNLHTYNELEIIFNKLLESIDYKINIDKLELRLDTLNNDSLIIVTNQINQFSIR